MAENVIRRDIVEIDFDTNLKELNKINKEVNDLKKKLLGGVGDEEFEKLKRSSNEAVKPLKKVKEQADKVTKSITDIGKKAATTAFKGLKKLAGISFKALAVGITAAATAVGALVKNAVSAYAEYEQLYGGMQTLLGAKGAKNVEEYAKITGKSVESVKGEYEKLAASEKQVMQNANNAFKTAGLSANAYMETVTSFSAALTTSLGGDTVEAAKLADVAIKDMADNANKMGTPMENVQTVYSNLARGMYMTLDNLKLGYAGTKEGAMQMVNDAAKIDKSVKANDLSYANLVKAIHAVQVKMDIYGTTSKEAFGTIQGSLSTFKAAWGNLLPAMIQGGEELDLCINNLVDSIVGFKDETTGEVKGGLINNLMPAIQKALTGVGTLIERLTPTFEKELPNIIDALLPPLLTAATALLKALIKALPNIVKTIAKEIPDILKQLGEAIGEAFGDQFPALKKFGDFISENGKTIANIIPYILGLVGAFMAFKKIKSVASVFSGLFGKSKGGEGNEKSGFLGTLSKLAKMKTTDVLKGMANIAIIVAGFVGLAAILLLVAPYITKLGGIGEFFKLVALIGVLGIVGGVLAKFGEIAGKIPVATVAKGLANMAIMIAGMTALLAVLNFAISYLTFDVKKILVVAGLITVLGLVGTALSLFGAIAGIIPVSLVALGLANMAIMIAGLSALFLLVGAVSLIPFDLGRVMQITLIIGVLGLIGTALTLFGAIAGLIPVPIVALGLANMAIIFAGMSALFLMIGATSLLDFDLGRMLSIIGIIGVLGTVGAVLTIFAGILGLIPMPLVLLGIANMGLVFAGVAELGKKLTTFANNTEGFFTKVAKFPESGFKKAGKLFNCLAGLKSLPKDGGVVGWFSGSIDYSKIATGLKQLSGEGVVKFFTMVGGLKAQAFTNTSALFKALGSIKDLPKEGGLWDKVTGEESSALGNIADELGKFGEKTKAFFTQVNSLDISKLNGLWGSLKNAGKLTTKNLSGVIGESISSVVSKISELPKKMGDALKNNSKDLSNGMVEMWKVAVKASVAPVNKLLDGANHILKEFGSKKRAISWQPYAKGTNGHKGGNALVNDGRGAELIQMPNGRTFIPNGRNVFLPNAPKGMKVLPAEQTARLMGKSSPSFRYADGIGDIDIWNYFDNAKGLVDKISEGISYKGMSVFAANVGSGMVSTFKGEMSSWVDKLFKEEGGKSLASYVASKGVNQWRSTVARALKMEGQYSAANVKRTLFQMQTESGGNPRALNLWDSNAKKGIPSKGLMQVIDPTFRAYARKGFDKNIYDPLSNILASVRYATSRYGSLSKAYRGVGYADGVGTITTPEQSFNLSYTPERDSGYYSSTSVENNSYAPQFILNINGANNEREMKRKVKRWIVEAWEDMLDNLESKTPQTQQV